MSQNLELEISLSLLVISTQNLRFSPTQRSNVFLTQYTIDSERGREREVVVVVVVVGNGVHIFGSIY